MTKRPKKDAFENYILIRNLSTYALLHSEIYHFYCNVHSVRLLASALAYLSSDV